MSSERNNFLKYPKVKSQRDNCSVISETIVEKKTLWAWHSGVKIKGEQMKKNGNHNLPKFSEKLKESIRKIAVQRGEKLSEIKISYKKRKRFYLKFSPGKILKLNWLNWEKKSTWVIGDLNRKPKQTAIMISPLYRTRTHGATCNASCKSHASHDYGSDPTLGEGSEVFLQNSSDPVADRESRKKPRLSYSTTSLLALMPMMLK